MSMVFGAGLVVAGALLIGLAYHNKLADARTALLS